MKNGFFPLFMIVFFLAEEGEVSGAAKAIRAFKSKILGHSDDDHIIQQIEVTPYVSGGRKGIQLVPMEEIQIEMPNGSTHNFGEDFHASLTTQLMSSGRYIVMDLDPVQDLSSVQRRHLKWAGSSTAAVRLRIEVAALSFETGTKDDSHFYGFDERMRTPFNDGFGSRKNEFSKNPPQPPTRGISSFGLPPEPGTPQTEGEKLPEPLLSWFGESFYKPNSLAVDPHAVVNLDQGINLNWFFGWTSLRYSKYHADIHLKLWIDTPLQTAKNYQLVEVKGKGRYLEASTSYEGAQVGARISRQDVMIQALKKAIASSYHAIDLALREAPFVARVDGLLRDGSVLLGTGESADLPLGTLFQSTQDPELVVQVTSREPSGSVGKIVRGDLSLIRTGVLLSQVQGDLPIPIDQPKIPARPVQRRNFEVPLSQSEVAENADEEVPYAVSVKSYELPELRYYSEESEREIASRIKNFAAAVKEAMALPGQIWRALTTDRSYHAKADPSSNGAIDLQGEAWATQIGLTDAPDMVGPSPVVAILDSGVAYNDPILHDFIWKNPEPIRDSHGHLDLYGWDFLGNSPKPFDSGYHGTQLASLVLVTAPKAKLMPLKVFDSQGKTHSAAIYAAFLYAVDHGAHIILCGWSTALDSEAISMGVAYAHEHGVAVVTSGGDPVSAPADKNQTPLFPASLSKKWSHVLAVGGLDAHDRWFPQSSDLGSIQILAPGKDIHVAEPGARDSYGTSTDFAAAIAAGALARIATAQNFEGSHVEWIQKLLADADAIPSLESYAPRGLRLRVRR